MADRTTKALRLMRGLALSVVAWVVATLVAAAGIELVTGSARHGLVSLVMLVLVVPALFLIWRPRKQ